MIKPLIAPAPFQVYCEMDLHRGWTVIMRRYDGSEDFYKNWVAYKNGFGDLNGEHYLGNDKIHYITFKPGPLPNLKHSLRLEMTIWQSRVQNYIEYEKFAVTSSTSNYTLHIIGAHGNIVDRFLPHNGTQFSTFDVDNDKLKNNDCAVNNRGAFWFGLSSTCTNYINLMGPYQDDCSNKCILWWDDTLRAVTMKLTRYNPA